MDGDALRISAASARLDCADISIVQGPEDEREVEDVEDGDERTSSKTAAGGRRVPVPALFLSLTGTLIDGPLLAGISNH